MPTSGGSATITGVDYELWFSTLYATKLFFEQENIVEIKLQSKTTYNVNNEVEITAVDDLQIKTNSGKIFYNLKYRAPNQVDWKFSDLKGVLDQFKEQFKINPQIELKFASQSGCILFDEIFKRTASCTNVNEIEYVLSVEYLKQWKDTMAYLSFSEEELFHLSKKVSFEQIAIITIPSTVNTLFSGRVTNDKFAGNTLFQLVKDYAKYPKSITKNIIEQYFIEQQITRKSNILQENIIEKFENASVFLASSIGVFGNNSNLHIQRKEVDTLYEWIVNDLIHKESPIAVLTGLAGCGKTTILKDLYNKLSDEKIPVLGLKTDRLVFDNTELLLEELQFEDDFKPLFSAICESHTRVVCLIDQIDALSMCLSANRKPLGVYEAIVERLSKVKNTRIIISCRKYDLEYDPNLIKFKNKKEVQISNLSNDEVKGILTKVNINFDSLPLKLKDILLIPLHLDIFIRLIDDLPTNFDSIRSLNDLYRELWRKKILTPPNSINRERLETLFFDMAALMSQKQDISIPLIQFESEYYNELNYLNSQGLIYNNNKQIQFFHQTFFDYVFARNFILKGEPLSDWIYSQHQGLFIRSQIKQIIIFLKEADSVAYKNEITVILSNAKYRLHIKHLIISYLASEQEPTLYEKKIFEIHILTQNDLLNIFLESISSFKWFAFFIKNKFWGKLVEEDFKLNIYNLCYTLINQNPDGILDYLSELPYSEQNIDCILYSLLRLNDFSSPKAINLFDRFEKEILMKDLYTYFHVLENTIITNQELILPKLEKAIIQLSRQDKNNNETEKKIVPREHDIHKCLEKLNQEAPIEAFTFFVRIIFQLVEIKKSAYKRFETYLEDDLIFDDYTPYESNLRNEYEHFIYKKTIEYLSTNIDNYLNEIGQFLSSNHCSIIAIGVSALNTKIRSEFSVLAYNFLAKQQLLNDYDISSNSFFRYNIRLLLKNYYPFFNSEQKTVVLNLLLQVNSRYEVYVNYYYKRSTTWDKYWLTTWGNTRYGLAKFKLLSQLPQSEILSNPELKKEYQELERKKFEFKNEIENRSVWHSARGLKSNVYDKLNQKAWLASFIKIKNNDSFFRGRPDPTEHARSFKECVKKEPDKFYQLIDTIVLDYRIPHVYIYYGLEGLKDISYDIDKFYNLFKKAISRHDLGSHFLQRLLWIANYLTTNKKVDKEVLFFLIDNAITLKEKEIEDDDYLMRGSNSIRGVAIQRIVECYFLKEYEELIFNTLFEVALNGINAQKSALLLRLAYLLNLNKDKTIHLFLKIFENNLDSKLFKSAQWSLSYLINHGFNKFIDFFNDSLELEEPGEAIYTCIYFAWLLNYENSEELIEKAYSKSIEAKKKAFYLACENMHDLKYRDKCIQNTIFAFIDDANQLSHEYDILFLHFKPSDFEEILPFLKIYSSASFIKKSGHYFFEYLLKCVHKYPLECVELISEYKDDNSSNYTRYNIYGKPFEIILQAYNSNNTNEKDNSFLEYCIDQFDNLYLNSSYRRFANEITSNYER